MYKHFCTHMLIIENWTECYTFMYSKTASFKSYGVKHERKSQYAKLTLPGSRFLACPYDNQTSTFLAGLGWMWSGRETPLQSTTEGNIYTQPSR